MRTRLTDILSRHGVHPQFWHDFRLLVAHGRQPSGELETRLQCVTNYKAALQEALTPRQFESLNLENVQ